MGNSTDSVSVEPEVMKKVGISEQSSDIDKMTKMALDLLNVVSVTLIGLLTRLPDVEWMMVWIIQIFHIKCSERETVSDWSILSRRILKNPLAVFLFLHNLTPFEINSN